jgi:glycosyltransferase involved in cell wall biosynthesis
MLVENNPYPQDVRVHAEAVALKNGGYDVTVIGPAQKGQARREVISGIEVYRFRQPAATHGFLGYAWEYAYSTVAIFLISLSVWAGKGFDVIHAANPPETLVLVAAFYKIFGKRFIFDHHDLSPEMYCAGFGGTERDVAYRILLWLERLSCRLADHIIATNESYKRIDIERAGIPANRITVVRNGPEISASHIETDKALDRGGKSIIAYVGIMGSHDGLDYLLRSLQHLAFDLGRTDFLCFIIGAGPMLEQLKRLNAELGLDPYVMFTGWISEADKLRYLSSADICVDPDPSNSFNDRSTMIKIVEYMSLGKPIVAFDLPENRFTAQQAGLFVQPNDELEFAKALAQLMDDPSRRKSMGTLGQRRFEAELAWSHSVPYLLAAYRTVLPGRQTKQSICRRTEAGSKSAAPQQ